MHENAFAHTLRRPTESELAIALGPAKAHWDHLIDAAREIGVVDQEWKLYSPKFGWTLRLKQKKRTIAYLSPAVGNFLVSFVLGDRAMDAALHIGLSKSAIKILDGASRYPEGTAVRIDVRKQQDIKTIVKLMTVKLTP